MQLPGVSPECAECPYKARGSRGCNEKIGTYSSRGEQQQVSIQKHQKPEAESKSEELADPKRSYEQSEGRPTVHAASIVPLPALSRSLMKFPEPVLDKFAQRILTFSSGEVGWLWFWLSIIIPR